MTGTIYWYIVPAVSSWGFTRARYSSIYTAPLRLATGINVLHLPRGLPRGRPASPVGSERSKRHKVIDLDGSSREPASSIDDHARSVGEAAGPPLFLLGSGDVTAFPVAININCFKLIDRNLLSLMITSAQPPDARTVEDVGALLRLVAGVHFFRDLGPEVRAQLCRVMRLEVRGGRSQG